MQAAGDAIVGQDWNSAFAAEDVAFAGVFPRMMMPERMFLWL
jgi:phosphosulfolactate phosphohydrolase-like enzyme